MSGDLPAAGPVVAGPVVAGYERARHAALPPLVQAEQLVTELSCVACHTSSQPTLQPKRGPLLSGLRARLQYDWVRQFLSNPHKTKPGTTMPDLLGGMADDERASAIERLTHYLGTLPGTGGMFDLKVHVAVHPTVPNYWEKGDTEAGRELYRTSGCIACHPRREHSSHEEKSRLDVLRDQGYEEEDIAELIAASGASIHVPEVPHPDFARKYQKQALAVFLFDPHRFRPASRMPAMKLSPAESADLVAYLMGSSKEKAAIAATAWPQVDAVLAEEGAALFRKLGCQQCHATQSSTASADFAKPWETVRADAETGCLGVKSTPAEYALTDEQITALRTLLQGRQDKAATTPTTATMLRFNCYACHRRGELGGVGIDRWHEFETVGEVDIGDEGRVPPALDGVGAKLHNAWMATVFKGEGDIRPHLQIRMPIFRHDAIQALPAQLEATDDGSRRKAAEVFPKQPTSAAMAIAETGCIQCHTLGGERLPGVVGVEIAGLENRLRPEWFAAFLRNPAELKRRTRMPTFFPQGRTTRPDLLDGRVDRQIASLWWYLADSNVELPEKLAEGRVHNFELTATDKPIILRTFFEGVGTHAICVGYPEGRNLAFDGRQAALGLIWKGRFLDAHGTWYDRFVPPAKPLGTDVVQVARGPGAHANAEPAPWPDEVPGLRAKGYRLVDGAPVFRYQVGRSLVNDSLRADASQSRDGNDDAKDSEPGERPVDFVRQISVQGPDTVWIQLASGESVVRENDHRWRVGAVTLSGDALSEAVVIGEKPSRIVLRGDPQTPSHTVRYQW